ncbi:hypothetical protein MNBD_GAMMA08-2875 [hydrothermal vent metagenome]|uniref:Uncharacterized protein n=1 Tax=hydrothermal vent metagenome TaxID=652676 RepID=A0A3B0WVK0_9ZZZZ
MESLIARFYKNMNKMNAIFVMSLSLYADFLQAGELESNLYDAIARGDYDYASNMISKGADVNIKHKPFNQSPIIMAPLRGMEFVELLVENGADVNSKDQDNTTALINACLYGNTEVAKYLISKGAKINAKNNDDMTVIEAALISENKRLIRYIKSQHAK